MKTIYLQALKVISFVLFCSFNAFGQTQAYSIKRGEISNNNKIQGKYYEVNTLFFMISDHNKVIIMLNAEGNKTFTFDVEKITLDGRNPSISTYSCMFLTNKGYQSAIVSNDYKEKKITVKDYSGRIMYYYY